MEIVRLPHPTRRTFAPIRCSAAYVDHAFAALVDKDHGIARHGETADQRRIFRDRLLKRNRTHPGVIHIAQLHTEGAGNANEIAFILKTAVSRFQLRDLGGIDEVEKARYQRGFA